MGDTVASGVALTQVRRSKFPTRHLVTGETILWEGRPSVIVYFLRSLLLFLFGLAFFVLAFLQLDNTVSLADFSTYLLILGMFVLVLLMVAAHRRWGALQALIALALVALLFLNVKFNWAFYLGPMVIGLVAFLFEYVLWSHTYFAISDRRIMTQYGVFSLMFADTQIDRIQNVSVVQPLVERILGYGDVMFATAGEMGGIKSDDPVERMRAGGAIVWEDVPRPFEVRKIAEEIIFRSTRPAVQYVPQPYVPAPAPVQVPSISSIEAEERLVRLKEMREKNLISEEEYQAKRQEILGRL